jgi:hypothetical protein
MLKLDACFGADDERSNTAARWDPVPSALLINPHASVPVLVGATLGRLQRCQGTSQAADVAGCEDGSLAIDGTNSISAIDSLPQEAGALLHAIDWDAMGQADGAAK